MSEFWEIYCPVVPGITHEISFGQKLRCELCKAKNPNPPGGSLTEPLSLDSTPLRSPFARAGIQSPFGQTGGSSYFVQSGGQQPFLQTGGPTQLVQTENLPTFVRAGVQSQFTNRQEITAQK